MPLPKLYELSDQYMFSTKELYQHKQDGWALCETYIRSGFLPPFWMCDLPPINETKPKTITNLIISACIRTSELVMEESYRTIEHLKTIRKELKGQSNG